MSTPTLSLPSRRRRRARRSRRLRIWLPILAVVVLALAAVAWIAIRGTQAVSQLEKALPIATRVQRDATSGDTGAAQAGITELREHADRASSLTSDPVWRAAELLPGVGRNLAAVRKVSASAAAIADEGLDPLLTLLHEQASGALQPKDGKLELKPLADLAPSVATANRSVQSSASLAASIEADRLLTPLQKPVKQYQSELAQLAQISDGANRAISLLPAMLGQSGERHYLLLFLNNAELRAGGGIPGSIAYVSVDNGRMVLKAQASDQQFTELPKPVLPLSEATRKLYGNITGTYMQDVMLTPRFPESAQLAAAMWKKKFGGKIDGVVTLDPVGLSYLLGATGPVHLTGTGPLTAAPLTEDNVVPTLLSDVYTKIPNPDKQDTFFQEVSSAVFAKLSGGDYHPAALLQALAQAGDERRLNIWSSHADEETLLQQTTLAGGLPASASAPEYGIYLADGTGSKMDYYLRTSVQVSSSPVCQGIGQVDTLRVTLKSTAPHDAATALPRYVTGGGAFGVPSGTMRTIVTIYAPAGRTVAAVHRDGHDAAITTVLDDGRLAAQYEVNLKPGESSTWAVAFAIDDKRSHGLARAVVTPQVKPALVSRVPATCVGAVS